LLVVAAFLALAAASHSEPQTVNLTMIDYRFIPDHLIFEHDVHFRLHLENHGKETHELTAPTFFATSDIDNPEALNHERTEIGDAAWRDERHLSDSPPAWNVRPSLRRPRLGRHGGWYHRRISQKQIRIHLVLRRDKAPAI
jgi:hypothetical protein